MSDTGLTVHIVDDDPAMRDSLALLLSLRGYRTASFASAEDFLAAIRPDWVGCILADIRMPGMSGLEMQHALASRGTSMPVIVLTAHGDVESARAAFKAHAIDFLEKPFADESLLAAIEQALGREASRVTTSQARERQAQALSALTPRERDVLELVVLGQHNREVAERLGISPRTVEVHKARLMEKLGVGSLAELLRVLRPGA
jgi:RNA polymerase sigma factor (sigma-70 family)